MSQSEVKKIVKRFAAKLKADKFDFSSIYMFGSYVKGRPNKFSDIDVAVVSKKMKKNYEKNLDLLCQKGLETSDKLEIHAFTPEDFKVGYPPLAHEIKLTGIRVV